MFYCKLLCEKNIILIFIVNCRWYCLCKSAEISKILFKIILGGLSAPLLAKWRSGKELLTISHPLDKEIRSVQRGKGDAADSYQLHPSTPLSSLSKFNLKSNPDRKSDYYHTCVKLRKKYLFAFFFTSSNNNNSFQPGIDEMSCLFFSGKWLRIL